METVADRLDKYLDKIYKQGHLLTELSLSERDTAEFIYLTEAMLNIKVDRTEDTLYYKFTKILM